MSPIEEALELALAPERWYVELKTGEVLEILTHSYTTHDGRYVFSLLFVGSPDFLVTSFSIPEGLVAKVYG
jgi:hypothetical protein